jgi:hypothetical protein
MDSGRIVGRLAEDFLAAGDVGLIPWALLAQIEETPDLIVCQCRD